MLHFSFESANLNEIPIPVICSTALNCIPQYGINTDLGAEDIEKLLTQNTDIQKVFEEYQFNINSSITQNSSSFFSSHIHITGAILAATALTVGYLSLNKN